MAFLFLEMGYENFHAGFVYCLQLYSSHYYLYLRCGHYREYQVRLAHSFSMNFHSSKRLYLSFVSFSLL